MSIANGTKYATLSASQIRSARALLNWSRELLAERSGVSMRTLARIEAEEVTARGETLELIGMTLFKAGIRFIKENGGGVGVRFNKRT